VSKSDLSFAGRSPAAAAAAAAAAARAIVSAMASDDEDVEYADTPVMRRAQRAVEEKS